MLASVLSTVFLTLDFWNKEIFDLASAFAQRNETANALLNAEASNSSIWFQIAFLLYPSGYVYSVVHALYAYRLKWWKLVVFGMLPVLLATIVMGGRTPIFLVAFLTWLALKERDKIYQRNSHELKYSMRSKPSRQRKWLYRFCWSVFLVILLKYFVDVFLVRAESIGGSIAMFDYAKQTWGVGFNGPLSGLIITFFGQEISYLIFIFAWYITQGFVMSTYLFSAYDGPLQMGIYGVDLVSALMRRFDPLRVADGFNSLFSLGTYGFLPSAWGSLYVDFGLFGIVFCVFWGYFAALCYRRIVLQRRADWFFLGPFTTIGIVLSIINTPFGFANGLVIYVWLYVAFLLLKREHHSTSSIF